MSELDIQPDPGNSDPEAWEGPPVPAEAEREQLEAALALDVRDQPYEVEGWRAEFGEDIPEVSDGV